MPKLIGWLFRDSDGEITLFQKPNVFLWAFIVCVAIRLVFHPEGSFGTVVTVVGTTAIIIWAILELLRGINPFRRILGAVVLCFEVIGLIRR